MDNELLKSEQLASAIKNCDGEYRILAVEGKAVYAEKFGSVPSREPIAENSIFNVALVSAIALFGLGVVAGTWFEHGQNVAKIQQLTAEKLILESKISKIRDLVK